MILFDWTWAGFFSGWLIVTPLGVGVEAVKRRWPGANWLFLGIWLVSLFLLGIIVASTGSPGASDNATWDWGVLVGSGLGWLSGSGVWRLVEPSDWKRSSQRRSAAAWGD